MAGGLTACFDAQIEVSDLSDSEVNSEVLQKRAEELAAAAAAANPPALQLSPANASVMIGASIQLVATGGVPPYSYAKVSGSGTLNSSTGLYTAPNATGTATISVTDAASSSVTSTVSVVAGYRLCQPIASAQGATGTLYDSGGQFSSYQNSESCGFLIQPQGNPGQITLSFTQFDFENGLDYLRVYDGTSASGTPLHTGNGLTGWAFPQPLSAYSGSMYIEISTSAFGTFGGFSASWVTSAGGSPVPDFTFSTGYPAVNESVSFTDTSTSSPTSWQWDFNNDGLTDSTAQNPSHAFNSIGMYTVRLTVSNASGSNTRLKTLHVGGYPMCGAVTSSARDGSAIYDSGGNSTAYGPNENCGFLIQPSTAPGAITLTFTMFDLENGADFIRVYDGTSAAGTPLHTGNGFTGWNTPPSLTAVSGSMYVVMISNSTVQTSGFSAFWNSSPPGAAGASFTWSPTVAESGQSVTFTDTSTNSPTSWAWDFDNNGVTDSTLQNPSFVFPGTGEYLVKLTVSNASGGSSKQTRVNIASYRMCEFASSTFTSGTLTDSGGSSASYGPDESCAFLIQPPGSPGMITVSFNTFDLENGFDFLKIYDGTSAAGVPLHPGSGFTGWSWPPNLTAVSGALYVVFTSNSSIQYGGFGFSWSSSLPGSPGPDFTTNPAVPEPGQSVSFTDTSTNTPTTWAWDFNNDGITDSTLQNPSHTFGSGGIFDVRLTVTNANGSNNRTKPVYVGTYPLCAANVTSAYASGVLYDSGGAFNNYQNNENCAFLIQPAGGVGSITLSFLNMSLEDGYDYVKVYDGTSEAGTPLHTGLGFTGWMTPSSLTAISGSMYVVMTTSASGINSGFEANWTSTPPGSPGPQFEVSPGVPDAGQLVTFTDNSVNNPTSWAWDFDNDGITDSVLQNPTHTFGSVGVYPVKLTATNASGSSSITKSVFVSTYHLCGSQSVAANATGKVFDSGGAFNSYQPNENCAILIQPPGNPGTITLSFNQFGLEDGFDFLKIYDGTSEAGTPLHTGAGFTGWSWPPTLTAISGSMYIVMTSNAMSQNSGFEVSWTSSSPGSPGPDFSLSQPVPQSGQAVTFNDLSTNNPTSWAWDFNDDGITDSTAQNPVHVFGTSGVYNVKLTVTNAFGSNFRIKPVYVDKYLLCGAASSSAASSGELYDSGGWFNSYQPNEYCAFLIQPPGNPGLITLTFTTVDMESNTDFVEIYDGSSTSGEALHTGMGLTGWNNPGPTFHAYSGSMYLVMSTSAWNQWSGFTASWIASPPGSPGTAFSFTPSSPRYGQSVTFTDQSTNSPTSWAWDFNNDGITDSTDQNPTHIFNAAGYQTVKLTSSNANGSTSRSYQVPVEINYLCQDTSVASPVGLLYDSGGLGGPYGSNEICGFLIQPPGAGAITLNFSIFDLNWGPGDYLRVYDGIDETGIPFHNGNGFMAGSAPGVLVATSGAVYVKMITDSSWTAGGIQMSWSTDYGPGAIFTASADYVDPGESITFTDGSSNNPTSWAWDFDGNGTTDSVEQNPTHLFNSAGVYNVTLTVSNVAGGSSKTKKIYVGSYLLCSQITSTTKASGNLYDSGGPGGQYSNNEICGFLIAPPGAVSVTLNFTSFSVESYYESVRAFDGANSSGIPLHPTDTLRWGGYYGWTASPGFISVTANSGMMYVEMTSDGSVLYDGFSANWTSNY